MEASTTNDKKELFHALRRHISDEKVLEAMKQVPREEFVLVKNRYLAYKNMPLPNEL